MKDDEPTPEELREAEALARALEGAPSEAAPPPEALEAAALLRHAHRGGELDPARAQVIAAGLRAQVQQQPRPPRRRRWIWLLPPLAVGAAALVLLLPMTLLRRPDSVPPPAVTGPLPRLTAFPAPGAALLAAQAEAARGGGQGLGDLDAQMRAYRQALFARLREGRR